MELKLAQESWEEASAFIRGPWPRSPITLSSTCNLMQHGEEGAPLSSPYPLPSGRWFMIEDMLIKISKQSGLCWGRYRGMRTSCSTGKGLLRDILIVWMPHRPAFLNRICSCCFCSRFFRVWGESTAAHKVTFVWTCAAFSPIGEPSWNPDPKGARSVFLSLKHHDEAHTS